MFSIREGTFETNSSSTHSICIPKEDAYMTIPKRLEINLNDYEFGWEYEEYDSVEERFAYLIFGITAGWQDTYLEQSQRLEKLLKTIGRYVETIKVRGLDIVNYNNQTYYETYDGYVDHASELKEMVDTLLENEDMLKRYLFSDNTFILTGNDNADGYQEINVSYPHDEFYKGN